MYCANLLNRIVICKSFREFYGNMCYKAPSQMNASGYYGELNLVELRYRPWRDGNLFSWGITTSVERHPLGKGFSFLPVPGIPSA